MSTTKIEFDIISPLMISEKIDLFFSSKFDKIFLLEEIINIINSKKASNNDKSKLVLLLI